MDAVVDRVPPHDMDAEKSLLGAMMLSESAADTVLGCVEPADFYRSAHALIFNAIVSLRSDKEPCDVVAVADRIGDVEKVGGKGYLLDLVNCVAVASHAPKYATIVRDTARLRAIIQTATGVIAEAYIATDADEVESRAVSEFAAIQRPSGHKSESLRSLIDAELEALKTKQDYITLPAFDAIPICDGELIVLGARPKHGKSAFAAQTALDWSLSRKTAFFSFEMSSASIVRRIISRFSGMTSRDLLLGMCDTDVAIVNGFMEGARIDERQFTLKHSAGQSPKQTFAAMRRFAAAGGRTVVLDYLQLAARARAGTLREDVTVFSNELKQVLGETGLSCLALSQLKRPDDVHTLAPPTASSLRESGAIEQDADAVFLMMTLPSLRDPEHGEKALDFALKRTMRYEFSSEALELDEWPNHDKRMSFIEAELVRNGEPDRRPFVFDGSIMSFEPLSVQSHQTR